MTPLPSENKLTHPMTQSTVPHQGLQGCGRSACAGMTPLRMGGKVAVVGLCGYAVYTLFQTHVSPRLSSPSNKPASPPPSDSGSQ
mmetsp:Transcript_106982/g.159918  ORF Transcript_106982/g.159918 Transcript_106982/m.159918 type:complete len:85 (-) Transcript_106982:91-345(-)